MKKAISVLLAILFVLSFAGCKKSTENGSSSDIEFVKEKVISSDKLSSSDENEEKGEKKDSQSDDEDEYEIITSTTSGTSSKRRITKASSKCSHSFSDATCEKGKVCKLCGYEEGEPLGHDIVAATCTEASKCKRCGHLVCAALGHQMVNKRCTRCSFSAPSKTQTAIFVGDSIGQGETPDNNFCSRLESYYSISCYNGSIAGWSLSNREGRGIYKQLQDAPTDKKYDFVFMHGGVNDVWHGADKNVGVEWGSITPKGTTTFDLNTVAGGIEMLFYTAQQKYPTSKHCFILNYYPQALNLKSSWDNLVPIVKEACEKWGVAYFAFDDIKDLDDNFIQPGTMYVKDGVHPTKAGYDMLTAYLWEWIKTL